MNRSTEIKWLSAMALGVMALGGVGCAAELGTKAPLADDFSALQSADGKEDTLRARMTIVGSLEYGDTSATVRYNSTPRYRAFKFAGNAGDNVDIWVRGTRGDAVAFLLDDNRNIIASNDDAAEGGTLNAHITASLTANANPDIHTYYIAFRDYYFTSRNFTVELQGESTDFTSCEADSDCVKVQQDCCPHQGWTAVNASSTEAFRTSLECPTPTYCIAIAVRPDSSVAQCNRESNECELVAPKDIACGGRTRTPRMCPTGYECQGSALAYDGFGHCVKRCGGFAGFACDLGDECVDDSGDSCDVERGGADCGGLCKGPTQCEYNGIVHNSGESFNSTDGCNTCSCNEGSVACTERACEPAPTDCRDTGCGDGEYCTFCWVNFACIPEGAVC